ncbi:MAG: hypothetical protein Q4C45_11395 [Oscillospiraceae bacterium]|nr:hypothetical protein [Oscillospiraceae bacterium]
MGISEYDAFGPWVYEIDGDHPLPPLFAPYVDSRRTYQMLFKIPRNLERRRATPDMDLYDQVVGVDGKSVCIWTRREKRVEFTAVPFREITGLRLYQKLLLGICTIYGREKGTEIRYNTVSASILWRFADLIRGACPEQAAAPAGLRDAPALREDSVDIWLYNQMRDLRERGTPFTPDAYQPCWSPARTGVRPPWAKPEEFAGTLYLHNDRELLLLRSGKPERKGEQKYSAEFTSVPWGSLRGVVLARSDRHADCVTAEFRLPGTALRTEVQAANREALRFLEQLAREMPVRR